jgi:hypothetical protein
MPYKDAKKHRDYYRDYMRRRRAGEAAGRPKAEASHTAAPAVKAHTAAPALEARVRELEAQLAGERARRDEQAGAADAESLPKSYRERFEAMCRRQAREFEWRVKQAADAEARRLFDEFFLPNLRKRLEENEQQNKHIDAVLNGRKPIISKALFQKWWAYANPGTRDQMSEADHLRLWHALTAKEGNRKLIEIVLCGKEADRVKQAPIASFAELMAAREKVSAENSARAKRAAATRAAAKAQGK